jgi:hypothetical protein
MKGIVIAAVLLLIYIVFLIWYNGPGKPLSNDEVERYISIIEKRSGGPNAATNSATANLRKFGLEDDGQQFFMVSIGKYYDKPQYGDGDRGISSEEANKRYAINTIQLMLVKASHPYGLFIPLTNLSNINRQDDAYWDNASVIRYRSRRDFFDMVTSTQWAAEYENKVAALRDNPNLPSRAILAFPIIPILVLTILLLIGFITMVCIYFKPFR